MKIKDIGIEVDRILQDRHIFSVIDQRLIGTMLAHSIDGFGVTDAFRNADPDRFIKAVQETVLAELRARMVRFRMANRDNPEWLTGFYEKLNAEMRGENVQWQALPWNNNK